MNIEERNCCIEHEGKSYCASGAYVDDERAWVYLDERGNVQTWKGENIGTYSVVSEWEVYHRNLGPCRYRSVRIHLFDGRFYHGRYNSDWSQLVKGKRLKERNK